MPLVPYYPSDEPDRDERPPDLDEIVDRIINGGNDRSPTPGSA